MGDKFKRKARIVARYHKTETPPILIQSSSGSRTSVGMCLLIVALNCLDMRVCGIQNAYLTVPCCE